MNAIAESQSSALPMKRFALAEAGQRYDVVEAPTAEAALKIARAQVDPDTYLQDDLSTQWIDIAAYEIIQDDDGNEEDGPDCASDTVTIDPEAPPCTETAHDLQTPHAIVGGSQENPGVFGKGGGIVCTEVCLHCGTAKTTDTWAENPENGEQGLAALTYEANKYQDEVTAIRDEREAEHDGDEE